LNLTAALHWQPLKFCIGFLKALLISCCIKMFAVGSINTERLRYYKYDNHHQLTLAKNEMPF